MVMAAKHKRVNEVYKFSNQHDRYFICEIENNVGSYCGAKISANQSQVTNKMRHNASTQKNL